MYPEAFGRWLHHKVGQGVGRGRSLEDTQKLEDGGGGCVHMVDTADPSMCHFTK